MIVIRKNLPIIFNGFSFNFKNDEIIKCEFVVQKKIAINNIL